MVHQTGVDLLSPKEREIQNRLAAVYAAHPFPKRTAEGIVERNHDVLGKLARVGISPEDFRGKRVLDGGCGTGELACLWASMGAEVTAIEIVGPSLEIAKGRAQEAGLPIRFIHGSLLEHDFEPDAYDLVISHMVLHHTANPERGFARLAKSVKPGGHFFICLFGVWGRLLFCQNPLWKLKLVQMLAQDPDRRVRIAERLFYRPGDEDRFGLDKGQYLYDAYGVTQVTHHTYGEVLRWYRQNGLEYVASWPPMEFRKAMEQMIAHHQPARSWRGRMARGVLRCIPQGYLTRARWANEPGWRSRWLTQAIALLKSDGSMFNVLGRKRRD